MTSEDFRNFSILSLLKPDETKSGRQFSLDTRFDFRWIRALRLCAGRFGFFGSEIPTSARFAGTDLCGRPRAGSAQQSLGIWHRHDHTDGLERPQSVRDSSLQKGAVRFWSLVHTGHVIQPVLVMVGGVAHFLLIIACMAGFLQLRPRGKQWGKFFGGGFLALGYFALTIAIARPR
jgi:hypothetical protein